MNGHSNEAGAALAKDLEKMLMDRNEAMDATHLAEFFQVEGVVADYDITLGNLVGMSSSHIFLDLFLKPLRGSQLINSVHGGVLCEDGK